MQWGWSKWESFLADHVRGVALAGGTGGGGTRKHIKVEGEPQGERGRPCLGTGLFGGGKEGVGVIPPRWRTFRDTSGAGMTQTHLLLQRGHPGGDLWSRQRQTIQEICARTARAYPQKNQLLTLTCTAVEIFLVRPGLIFLHPPHPLH